MTYLCPEFASLFLRLDGRWELEDLMNESQSCRAWRKSAEVVKVLFTPTCDRPDTALVPGCGAIEN